MLLFNHVVKVLNVYKITISILVLCGGYEENEVMGVSLAI